jgi:hypothetical protein
MLTAKIHLSLFVYINHVLGSDTFRGSSFCCADSHQNSTDPDYLPVVILPWLTVVGSCPEGDLT